jgi:hypothetical protein
MAISEYLVKFVDDSPAVGMTSEVEHAEVLDNGWVSVRWRDFSDTVFYYPPSQVVHVRTPRSDAMNLADRIKERIKRIDDRDEPSAPEVDTNPPEETLP